MITSSRAFYNHKKNSKSCCKNHVTISRADVDKVVGSLKISGVLCDEGTKRRKQRTDFKGKHNYPKNVGRKTQADSTAEADSIVPTGSLFKTLELEETPSCSRAQLGDYTADELIAQPVAKLSC